MIQTHQYIILSNGHLDIYKICTNSLNPATYNIHKTNLFHKKKLFKFMILLNKHLNS